MITDRDPDPDNFFPSQNGGNSELSQFNCTSQPLSVPVLTQSKTAIGSLVLVDSCFKISTIYRYF